MAEIARRNPLFPYLYSAGAALAELTFYANLRRKALAPARGKLLIVGLGPGNDLRHIPPEVTSVTAVEPDAVMRRNAERLAQRLGISLDLIDGVGEDLPFDEASFDSVLLALVLCSVSDVQGTLAEVRRVLKPSGQLLVLEHVRAPDHSLVGKVQDLIEEPWGYAASGCHPNRRTKQALAEAGFDVSDVHDDKLVRLFVPVMPHIVGRIPVAG